jgi:protein-S-isoprenylcysteine O-methyltransferase Ste14
VTLALVLVGVILLGELPSLGRSRPGSSGADRGSYAAITVLMTAGYWSAFFFAARPRGFAFGSWSSWLGTFLAVGGTLFRLWAIRTLGRFFTRSVRVSSDQPVVRDGPYRWLRHPSYTGSILASVGVGFALGNAVSLACLLAANLLGFGYRIVVEEKALADALGEPYRSYSSRTKRLIPFVW